MIKFERQLIMKLNKIKVAILVENGFELSEFTEPKKALEEAGAETFVVSPQADKVKGWKHGEWADEFDVEINIKKAVPGDYDALLLPGGVLNPDKLRRDTDAVNFVKHFFEQNKPVAAICHGPQMLIEAEVVEGRTLTSFSSIKKDLVNAGANWADQESVIDGNLVTSRNPDDIPAFNEAFITLLSKISL